MVPRAGGHELPRELVLGKPARSLPKHLDGFRSLIPRAVNSVGGNLSYPW
jgi:hypothetical protein